MATSARHVWIACRDANPRMAGGGAERLRAAGREVRFLADLKLPTAALLLADAERLLAPFSKRSRTGLPFVTIKRAITTAGSLVPVAGLRTFTSTASLELAHRPRRRADAILTFSGTILADGPLFNMRLVSDHPGKQRSLAILDRRRRVSNYYISAARHRGFAVRLAQEVGEALTMVGASEI